MLPESIKNSYRPQYNGENIWNLVFIKIWPALTEIKFQKRTVNINHKGNRGTPEASSGTQLRNKLLKDGRLMAFY